jgi:N-hydroxyarylamine O-acetyltransferase
MTVPQTLLDDLLLGDILAKLGFEEPPKATLDGLEAIYGAWCTKIPFDNLRKRIHLEGTASGPLPGDDPADFFQGWLSHGVGGTCWAGNGALFALLHALGFQVQRGLATMHVAPDEPPNHGTVIAYIEETAYLVDTSILHQIPLRLDGIDTVAINHPAWGITAWRKDLTWHMQWRPLHMPDGCRCSLNNFGVSHELFVKMNERTRRWGPFNYSVYIRTNSGDTVTGIAYGHKVTIDGRGCIDRVRITGAERDEFLIKELGLDREIVEQIPPDRATPPPPEHEQSGGEF